METPPSGPLTASWIYRFAWLFYLAMAVAGVLWIGLQRGVIPLSLFVADGWIVDVAAGLAAAAFLVALWAGARRAWAAAGELERRLAALLGPLEGHEVVALAALSGFAEELFFRGAVQSAWGPVVATLLFALLHAGPGPAFRLWTLFALVAGALFAALVAWRGNLAAPVVAHFAVNALHLHRLSRSSAATAEGGGGGEPDPGG